MEGGGEIRLCYNECNKDHLATATNSLNVREHTMRWLVCGFNGFGQLKLEHKPKLSQFEELHMPFTTNSVDVLVACSWKCLAAASRFSIHLQGFTINCPLSNKSVQTEVPIKMLDMSDKYCLVLLENGKVYKLDLRSKIELEEIRYQTSLTPIIPQKRNIYGDSKTIKCNLQIAHIACGNNITIAVSSTNAVFNGTTQIYQFPKHQRTKQLKCGFEHALLLTTNVDIFTWGNGLRGQLGLEDLRVEETPTMIEALAGIKIIDIAAGGWHSAAISAFGDLYTWGFNSNGQLGLRLYKVGAETIKEPSVYPLPQLIQLHTCCQYCENDGESSCYPIKVSAGGRHTILQMNCGSVMACGWNLYGQLGLKDQQYCDNFKFVHKLKDENCIIKKITCGNWCTMIND